MRIHTIEAEYEYRLMNIIKDLLKDIGPDNYLPETGDDLERWLEDNKREFADAVLNDINTWMGFDALLEQIKAS